MSAINPPRPSTNRLPLILIAAVALIVLVGGGLLLMSRKPIAPAANLAPIVIDRLPDRGEEQPTEAPIVLNFDKPMDHPSVEAAFNISPKVPGTFKWSADDKSVQFVPTGDGFARGTTYNVTLLDTAKAVNGKTLGQQLLFAFKAVGFLNVTQVIPADNSTDIDPAADITVMFNRPVVPLLTASDQTPLPQPLTFDPPIKGSGEWLNTSIYVFHPSERMQAGVKYTVKVAAGLKDPTGAVLQKDYAWSFSTQTPIVIRNAPNDNAGEVGLDEPIQVTFNQPMDHASVQAAFALHTGSIDGAKVDGTFTWVTETVYTLHAVGSAGKAAAPVLGGGQQQGVLGETMVFTPVQLLKRSTQYFAVVAAGAKAKGGGAPMPADTSWSFNTVQNFRVNRTDPADGSTFVAPYSAVDIYFSGPVKESTLSNITVSPAPISSSLVYTYYSEYDHRYTFGFAAAPSSEFEVTIGADVTDKWGQSLGQAKVIHFSTRALDPEQWFDVPGRFGTYSAYTDTVIYARYRNVTQLNFELYQVDLNMFAQLIGNDSYNLWNTSVPVQGSPIRAWSVPVTATLNKSGLMKVPVGGEAGGALTTGIYLIRVTSPENQQLDYGGITRHLIVVANTNVTFKSAEREGLVWATDLQSGDVTTAAPVSIYDSTFKLLANGRTGADGLFKTEWQASVNPFDTTAVVVGEPGGTFGIAINTWTDGIGPWDFGVNANYYNDPFNVYIYTEKPLYRPGQTVHFRGIVRLDDDARYAIDPNLGSINVIAYDSQGNQVLSSTLPLSEYGTFNADLKLDQEAGLGYYSIQAQILFQRPNVKEPQVNTYYGQFLVSEYVRPQFQVNVTADKDEVLQGGTINVDVEAKYFFGGSVNDADVSWTALSNNYYFDRYHGQGYFNWNDTDYFVGPQQARSGPLASGEGQTDSSGHFKITLPAKLDEKSGSQTFSIEASITDLNGQQVSGRVTVIVHQGSYYIGIAPQDYVGVVGKPLSFDLRSVDWQGDPSGQRNIDVVFYQREWFNVQEQDDYGNIFWTYSFSDTAVFTTSTTTTEGGEGIVAFTPSIGGEYHVVATGKDDNGNAIRSATGVWVSSQDYVSWRQENNDRIQLVADKKAYAPGDIAKILVPSPYQGKVKALVTVERGRILTSRVIDLQTNSDVIEVPITPDMAPNAFVSVIIVKGVDETNLAPSFKMGYASFTVNRVQQILNITLTPDRDPKTSHYGPREPISYTIKVTNYAGQPVQSEVSLALVDLSVLSLADPLERPIADQYYGERGLGVSTSTSLVYSVDRINAKLAQEAKGGGGGALAEGGDFFVRGNFPDTAYWNATVTTNANGEATISTVLPDNLTTWRLLAKAVSKETLVGEGQTDVLSTKDLLIEPVTPRFFIVGDKVNLAAIVHNNTVNDLSVEVSMEGTGISIDNGQVKQTVQVKANDKVRVEWATTIKDAAQADLIFTARGGNLSDATKPLAGLPPDQHLPIYKFSTPETTATAGTVDKTDPVRIEVVALPQRLDVTQGDLTVKIDPSLAAASTDGLNYLEHFPYECTEQTVSRFLPNVLTYKALKDLNLADPKLEATLKEQVGTGLQRLNTQQHADGGWGWWIDDQSDPTVSTYVVLGLVKAKQAGFAVDQNVIDRGVNYLSGQLIPTTQLQETWKVNRQAYILYVMAEAGKGDSSALVSLYDGKRQLLSNYGKALMALAFKLDGSNQKSRMDTLMSDLQNSAKTSATGMHWEEAAPDWYSWNTDTRSTAIVLDAFAQIDPKNQLAPNVVRWLMVARTAGHWETTQETAWSLIALTDWMKTTGELRPDYNWKVTVNDQVIGSGTANTDTVKVSNTLTQAVASLLRDQGNALTIERSSSSGQSGNGQLYYSAYLRTFIPVPDVKSLTRGIVIARQYFASDDACYKPLQPGEKPIDCTPVKQAKVGDTLIVKLSIIAPTDLVYVLIEDPLPAGTEAIDTSLKTTSQINQGPVLDQSYSSFNGWGWWWFTHSELRDEKVALFATNLPAGTYEYTYQIRAGIDGTFNVLPARAEEMYFPEVFGRSDGSQFVVTK
jgi:hypothetical protein